MPPTPLILFGDGPRLTSGLARIARDLAMRIVTEQEDLGVRLLQVGVDFPSGWHWQPWDFYGFQPTEQDQGREAVATVVMELRQQGPDVAPVVWGLTDPSRFYDITRLALDTEDTEVDTERLWLYAAIDAWNPQQAIGGPAADAVCTCERLLGYGQWGAGVLRKTLEQDADRTALEHNAGRDRKVPPVAYLPHGIDTRTFQPAGSLDRADETFRTWYPGGDRLIIGCVATNQPRKDLGTLFAAAAEIQQQGRAVAVWLHTDKLTHAWDVGELVQQFCLRKDQILVSTGELTDLQLAARYAWSDVTYAPGLGEGFGYPIVESLACGTPVVHGDYAGGVELIPDRSWLVPPVAWRLESIYALQRPVYHPKAVAEALLKATSANEDQATTMAYCSGSVAHLDWQHLWPRWRAWIKKGLNGQPRAQATVLHGSEV